MLRRLLGARTSTAECQCEVQTETAGEDGPLVIEASACPGEGQLRRRPGCRATAVGVVTDHGPRAILTRANGTDRRYGEPATTLLAAAGQTAIRVGDAEPAFATRARRDPLGAAHEASGRAGPIAAIAADTGLLAAAEGSDRYQRLLRPLVGLSIAGSFVDPELPAEARLLSTRTLADGTELKRYRRGDDPMAQFHVAPRSVGLSVTDRNTLAAAATLLTRGAVTDGPSAPRHAIEEAADDPDAGLETLADLLRRHTRGLGILETLLAVDGVTDVLAPAPVERNALRVRHDGDTLVTNVRLTAAGAAALGSRVRRASGRAFSRAMPTIDAGLDSDAGRLRIAGVTTPLSEGPGFAIRTHATDPWTIPGLVANGTLTPTAAALLSVAVERGAAVLVAGSRGAGKTTLLGALTWALPPRTRLVTIEDTPELPVQALQSADRDVQALYTDPDQGMDVTAALRTALRLGEGAIAVGEVRGQEAHALYEAMRVGANASAVLGTIHGSDATAVRRRVVEDLGVSPRAYAATDLVVTCERVSTGTDRGHRLASISEVVGPDAQDPATLFDRSSGEFNATGRIQRGNSVLVDGLSRPAGSYAAVLEALADRRTFLERLVADERTDPAAVSTAHNRRRADS